jgi:hypothetical protein
MGRKIEAGAAGLKDLMKDIQFAHPHRRPMVRPQQPIRLCELYR